ncbi:MAG: serine/threonine protein kinase, partial [Myxococcales bacterium]|nr:serine/threonine protein kinase [Myxococcales bacterium]
MLRACQRCGLIYRDGAEFCGVDGAPTVETDSDPLVGRRVGQYDVLAREDVGGVAVIYRARHAVVGHEVALKVLLGEMASRPAVAERFRREAHAACRIVHPNVVRTFDFGTSDSGVVYLTMELLRGVTLSARLGTAGLFSPQETRRLTAQIAEGLAAIHGLGYVHRDIKPGNIMLVGGPAGLTAKVIDFGLVGVQGPEDAADRLTRQGTVLGTPQYMAPEIIHGDPPSPAIDLYGLGATLYEMLSGKPPFEGTLTQILLAHVQTPPKPLPGTGDLGALALALLAKEPEDRPASAEVVTARLLSPPRPPRRGVKVAAAVGVAALALVAAA